MDPASDESQLSGSKTKQSPQPCGSADRLAEDGPQAQTKRPRIVSSKQRQTGSAVIHTDESHGQLGQGKARTSADVQNIKRHKDAQQVVETQIGLSFLPLPLPEPPFNGINFSAGHELKIKRTRYVAEEAIKVPFDDDGVAVFKMKRCTSDDVDLICAIKEDNGTVTYEVSYMTADPEVDYTEDTPTSTRKGKNEAATKHLANALRCLAAAIDAGCKNVEMQFTVCPSGK
jgi:hypothetical protein